MKLSSSICGLILLLAPALVFGQFDEYEYEYDEMDGLLQQEVPTVAPKKVVENVYAGKYFPAVAVASFTGPNIIGEFSFYQDGQGDVVATGALQKGLKQDVRYQFRFHEGPTCDNLGDVILEHEFDTMHVVDMGGTPPIQEPIPDIHLTGQGGLMGVPWVLADEYRDLACVILKGHQVK